MLRFFAPVSIDRIALDPPPARAGLQDNEWAMVSQGYQAAKEIDQVRTPADGCNAHVARFAAASCTTMKSHAEAAEYWRQHLANDAQSEWAARARRSLKFCEMQIHLSAS